MSSITSVTRVNISLLRSMMMNTFKWRLNKKLEKKRSGETPLLMFPAFSLNIALYKSPLQALTGKSSCLCRQTQTVQIFTKDLDNCQDWGIDWTNLLPTFWFCEEWMFTRQICLLLMIQGFMQAGYHRLGPIQCGATIGLSTIMKNLRHYLQTVKLL